MYEARLTAKALRQLNLWPGEDERALHLVAALASSLEQVSSAPETPDTERTKLRAAATVIRDFSVGLAAGLVVS